MATLWQKIFNQEPEIQEKKPQESHREQTVTSRSGGRLSTPKRQIERIRTEKETSPYPRYNPNNPAHNPQAKKKDNTVDKRTSDGESEQSIPDTWPTMEPLRRARSSIVALAESLRPKSKSKRPSIPFEAAAVPTMDHDNTASLHCSNSSDSLQPPEYIQHATGTRVVTRELASSSTDSLPQLRATPEMITNPRTYNRHSVPQYVPFQRLPVAPLKQMTNRTRRAIQFEAPPPPLSPGTPPPEYSLYDMRFSVNVEQEQNTDSFATGIQNDASTREPDDINNQDDEELAEQGEEN